MKEFHCLGDVRSGRRVYIKELTISGSACRRFLDIGLVGDTEVECLGKDSLGDPYVYLIRGAVIAVRSEDRRNILIYE